MMKKLSLREAAKICGRGKSTIAAAIGDGRLSAEKNSQGGYEIDPAELNRVFSLRVDSRTGQLIEQRTLRDTQGRADSGRPLPSLALSRVSDRTGRAGGALTQAETELRAALAEIDRIKNDAHRVKVEIEKDARHAAELAEKELRHLRETLDSEREAKADLKEAHEAHLRDLRRELEQVKTMLPAPNATPQQRGFWARMTGQRSSGSA